MQQRQLSRTSRQNWQGSWPPLPRSSFFFQHLPYHDHSSDNNGASSFSYYYRRTIRIAIVPQYSIYICCDPPPPSLGGRSWWYRTARRLFSLSSGNYREASGGTSRTSVCRPFDRGGMIHLDTLGYAHSLTSLSLSLHSNIYHISLISLSIFILYIHSIYRNTCA